MNSREGHVALTGMSDLEHRFIASKGDIQTVYPVTLPCHHHGNLSNPVSCSGPV